MMMSTGARGRILPPSFFNFLFIYLFSNLHVSILYTNYPQGKKLPKLLKSYPCSLRLHLILLIPIISFKLGHVSIPKTRSFSPLFLLCAYDHRHSNSGPPFFLIWSLSRLWYGSLSGRISLNLLSIFYNISCYNSLVLLTFVSRSSCRITYIYVYISNTAVGPRTREL
jgi:hypothetical protein